MYADKTQQNAWYRRDRQRHPEKYAARQQRYRANNLVKLLAQEKQYHEAHKLQRADALKRWRATHQEHLKAYEKLYRQNHKAESNATSRAYYRLHPEKMSAKNRRRYIRKHHAPLNDLTEAQWETIKAAYKHRCAYCHRKLTRFTQDHITPLSKGGAHTMANIVPACRSCNSQKRDKAPLVPVQPLML